MKFLFALAMILVILVILVYTAAAKGAGSWENRPAAIPAEALEYGFINRQGDFVIKPEYQHAWPFSEGVGMVSNTKELLFLNTEGKTLFTLPAEVVRITPSRFASGLSALDDHGLVYIDKSGQPVIKTQYGAGGWFVDGVAPVMVQSEWGFIDKTGKLVIEPTFDMAQEFSEGLAPVLKGNKWGYIDRTGSLVIKPQFTVANAFSEGLAAVFDDDERGFGYINRSGSTVIKGPFQDAGLFAEGVANVMIGHKIEYIDTSGKPLPKAFVPGYPLGCREGLIPAVVQNKVGFVDKTGVTVIPASYDRTYGFSETLAPVSIDGKWGYIDRSGKIVIQPQFADAQPFSESLAVVGVAAKK